MEIFDVVIIGGGPAGSAAARYLAGNGMKTALVEREPDHVKTCSGGMPSSVFDELEIDEDSVIKKIDSVSLVSPSGRRIEVQLTGGVINIVDRASFDTQLRDLAIGKGALLVLGDFRKLHDNGGDYNVEIRQKDECILNIKTRYVIGCDGVNSRVRRELGLSPVKAVYTYSETIKDAEADSCEFWFGERHAERFYSWVFPKKEGCSVGTGVMSKGSARNLYDDFLKRRDLSTSNNGRGYKIPMWHGGTYSYKRVLLAGDAASHVMPMTYEGIYYAMKSAQFASMAVVKDDPSLYGKLWNERFLSRFRLMRRLERYFLRNDKRAERLFDIFGHSVVREASSRLWFNKDAGAKGISSYISLLRKFLC
ncbi:MAG: geranylgeranyl reductase family protein [Thermodesulfovibrionales bacterium]